MRDKREYMQTALVVAALALFIAAPLSATDISGNVTTNTTWTPAGSPYVLTANVTVTNGATLTIEPGVEVRGRHTVLATDNTGAIVANGTALQPILFTSDGGSPGGWNGIYLNGQSGTPPASSLTYCTIEKGGGWWNGSNCDLCAYYHSNLTVSNCTFRDSGAHGIEVLGCSPALTSCAVTGNAGYGIYLSTASPILSGCTVTSNASYGVYSQDDGCNPVLTTCTVSGNAINPMRVGLNTVISSDTAISGAGCIEYWGGTTTALGRTWRNYGVPYRILGDVTITNGATLTVAAGVTVRMQNGVLYTNKTGGLIATGTPAMPITFTADDDLPGGWRGIAMDGEGGPNSASSLSHCIVEKGGAWWNWHSVNVYVRAHSTVTISSSTIRDSSGQGLQMSGCSPSVNSCTVTGSAGYGIYLSGSSPGLTSCAITSNGNYGIYCEAADCNPVITGCAISGNTPNPLRVGINTSISSNTAISGLGCIEYWGGPTNASNRTWRYYGVPYRILGNVVVRNRATLTIQAGNTVRFVDSGLLVGEYSSHDPNDRGILQAIGTESQPITFTSDSGNVGDWRGIIFDGQFDTDSVPSRTPPASTLTRCLIEKAGLWYGCIVAFLHHSNVGMQNCRLSDSGADGLYLEASSPTASAKLTGNIFSHNLSNGIRARMGSSPGISGCQLSDNGEYGLYCVYDDCNPVIDTSVFSGNGTAPMRIGLNSVFAGNTISGNGSIEIHGGITNASDRTWFKWAPPGRKYPGDYSLLSDITVRNGATVTIEPGCVVTLAGQLVIGQNLGSYDPTQRGALTAVGTPEAPIIFTSTSGQVGGWAYLYFDGRNDPSPMPSALSHCLIEKGGSAESTLGGFFHSAVTLNHCTVARCLGTALKLWNSDWNVSNSIFARNDGYGIEAIGSTPDVTCTDFWSNTGGDWIGFTPGAGCIQLDPRFWSSVDYHLQPDSPCCGTACDGTYMGVYPCGAPPAFDTYHAKTLPDGTEVELIAKTVAAGTEDFGDCAYIEETSRYSGLKIRKAMWFEAWEQDQVTATGVMRTNGCERYMDALTVTYAGTAGSPIRPLFMIDRTVGGPPGIVFTSGGGPAPGASLGLSNIGLLVRVGGRVTQVDNTDHWFFIDDGSGRVGTGGNKGIKVSLANLATDNVITLPFVGAFLTVTGVSTIEQAGSETYSVIRPRTQNDIVYP